jgi:ribosome-binding factor A
MKNRLVRVCEVIKRELGILATRDLDFHGDLITIASVDITPDLKQAHIYVSSLGSPGASRRALELFEKNRTHLQTELSRRVHIKHTPHLHFHLDESIVRGTRVIGIMEELGLLDENKK